MNCCPLPDKLEYEHRPKFLLEEMTKHFPLGELQESVTDRDHMCRFWRTGI